MKFESQITAVFAENVRRLLREQDRELSWLAETLNQDHATFRLVMFQREHITLCDVEKVARSLGVTVQQLLSPVA